MGICVVAVFFAGVTLAFGVLWEILEYAIHAVAARHGFEPLLVHYGPADHKEDAVDRIRMEPSAPHQIAA